MPKTPARGRGKAGTWRLENADVWMDIERATGLIRSMHFKRAGQDLFRQVRGGIPGYAGYLRIFDERDDRWYDDLRTPFTVSAASKRGNVVRLTRRYRGAPFTVRLMLRMEEDGLHWEVEAAKVGRAADRHALAGERAAPGTPHGETPRLRSARRRKTAPPPCAAALDAPGRSLSSCAGGRAGVSLRFCGRR